MPPYLLIVMRPTYSSIKILCTQPLLQYRAILQELFSLISLEEGFSLVSSVLLVVVRAKAFVVVVKKIIHVRVAYVCLFFVLYCAGVYVCVW